MRKEGEVRKRKGGNKQRYWVTGNTEEDGWLHAAGFSISRSARSCRPCANRFREASLEQLAACLLAFFAFASLTRLLTKWLGNPGRQEKKRREEKINCLDGLYCSRCLVAAFAERVCQWTYSGS